VAIVSHHTIVAVQRDLFSFLGRIASQASKTRMPCTAPKGFSKPREEREREREREPELGALDSPRSKKIVNLYCGFLDACVVCMDK
jgi:hypothetical protein